jgi:hypothetical protein
MIIYRNANVSLSFGPALITSDPTKAFRSDPTSSAKQDVECGRLGLPWWRNRVVTVHPRHFQTSGRRPPLCRFRSAKCDTSHFGVAMLFQGVGHE